MCRLLVRDVGGLSVCALEIERGGPSYTVDTLKAIHASHPDAQLTFIVGADTASTLPAWREPAKLLELADLAVAARTGSAAGGARHRRPADSPPAPAAAIAGQVPGHARDGGLLLDGARTRGSGEPIEDLVGPAVASYIAEHGLYRGRRRGADAPRGAGRRDRRYAADKKAVDVVELDLRGVLGYTDFFLVCSGNTGRQAKAIHDGILEGLKREHEHAAAPRGGLRPEPAGS